MQSLFDIQESVPVKRIVPTMLFIFTILTALLIFAGNGFAVVFRTSDLQGTWRYHGLVSGDSPSQTPGWYYGSHTLDSNEHVTSSSVVTDSQGNNTYTPTVGSFSISPSGFVKDSDAMVSGYMNSSKDMIVLVGTLCPGDSGAVCGYNLSIMVKDESVSYSTPDLCIDWGDR